MMKKTFLNVGVSTVAFIFGLAMVSFVTYRHSHDLETARSVCQKCVDLSKTEFIETKTLAEIIKLKDFEGRKVRIEARFVHDAGYTRLRDLNQEKINVPVGFDRNTIPCIDTEKSLQICTGYKTWYDHSVNLTLVGYLGKIDEKEPFQGGEYGFKIICIEQVNPTEEELRMGSVKFNKNPFAIFGW